MEKLASCVWSVTSRKTIETGWWDSGLSLVESDSANFTCRTKHELWTSEPQIFHISSQEDIYLVARLGSVTAKHQATFLPPECQCNPRPRCQNSLSVRRAAEPVPATAAPTWASSSRHSTFNSKERIFFLEAHDLFNPCPYDFLLTQGIFQNAWEGKQRNLPFEQKGTKLCSYRGN